MKVSIITATYNSAQTICDTLKSISEQTYCNIEYIVVDGGSVDNTLKILKEQGDLINEIIAEPDRGIYDALNKGVRAATGDVVGFLHSDDILAYPDAIKDVVEAFSENNCEAIYADLVYVSKSNIDKVVRYWRSGEYSRKKLDVGWMPPHPTFYMKRELYERYGLFNLNFKISADYDSLLRYLWVKNVSTSYLPKILVKMRVGGASNRSFKNILLKTKEDMLALKINKVPVLKAILWKNISKIPQFLSTK